MPRDYRRADTLIAPEPDRPDGPPCPGPCNTAWRSAVNRGQTDYLTPDPGDPIWCRTCTTRIRSALTDLPDLAARLAEEILSGVSAGLHEPVSGSRSRPIHDHEAPSFLLDEIAEWAGALEDHVRQQRDLDARTPHRDSVRTVAAASAFLRNHLDYLLEKPTAQPEAAGTQALLYHRRAQLLTGSADPEPVRVDGVACPLCDGCCLEHEIESGNRRQTANTTALDPAGQPILHLGPWGERYGRAWRTRHLTTQVTIVLHGAATGYIACRRCRPILRLTPLEYGRWTGLLARDACARGYAPERKLHVVFGGAIPPVFLAAVRAAAADGLVWDEDTEPRPSLKRADEPAQLPGTPTAEYQLALEMIAAGLSLWEVGLATGLSESRLLDAECQVEAAAA